MTIRSIQQVARDGSERALARVWSARWFLAAAGVAILAVNMIAEGPLLSGLLAVGALFLAAALVPVTMGRGRAMHQFANGQSEQMSGLTAATLAAAVSDPLIVFDRQGSVVHVNEAARTAFGPLNPQTSLQLRFRSPEMQALFEQVFSGETATATAQHHERVPVERVYLVTSTPASASLNVLIFKDQSETRRIDRMRADFIANASHELRTPLASISGFIETLRGAARHDPEARDNFLQIMHDQTMRMARLIDDLLSLSRLEMRPSRSDAEMVDIRTIVESVVDAMQPQARQLGVTIACTTHAGPTLVSGNRDELFQVFENLVANACKYGQTGGRVEIEIARSGSDGDHSLSVAVRDYGPGIAQEHIPRLTERFYRAETGSGQAHEGTGLGLSIVKHILTRHGAHLTIQSMPAQGSVFTVHFPTSEGVDT